MTTPQTPRITPPGKPNKAQQLRRRRRQQRQTLIFGTLIVALILTALVAISIISGVIQPPFERDFTQPTPDRPEDAPPLVCAPTDTLRVDAEEIEVYVFNGTSMSGLAGAVGDGLTEFGFTVAEVSNAPEGLIGTVRVMANEQNLDRAYTVAAHFDSPEVVLDARPDESVDVIIGTRFTHLLAEDAVETEPGTPLLSIPYCEAAETITPEPAPERFVEEIEGEPEGDEENADGEEAAAEEEIN